MNKDKKNIKKLRGYAVTLVLMIIIVIIIAAMADDREKGFQSQITEYSEASIATQNEIVALKDENYNLNQKYDALAASQNAQNDVLDNLNAVVALIESNQKDNAINKFNEIKEEAVSENLKPYYNMVKNLLN